MPGTKSREGFLNAQLASPRRRDGNESHRSSREFNFTSAKRDHNSLLQSGGLQLELSTPKAKRSDQLFSPQPHMISTVSTALDNSGGFDSLKKAGTNQLHASRIAALKNSFEIKTQ